MRSLNSSKRAFSTVNQRNAFTLIELLVVISIIGILMGLLISQLGGILGSSEKTKMQAIMRTWIIQLNEYKSHYGYYPPPHFGHPHYHSPHAPSGWKCDYCNNMFPNREEYCAHEETCVAKSYYDGKGKGRNRK